MDPLRPLQQVQLLHQQYPTLYRDVDQLRAQRGTTLPRWPDWCFLPLAGVVALLTRGAPQPDLRPLGPLIGIAGALISWRVTQGIYHFDPTVIEAVWDTPMEGELPTSLLYRLPEWCCYVPLHPPRQGLAGFFVHLEWDVNTHAPELRFVLDGGGSGLEGLVPFALHLDKPTLSEAIDAAWETSASNLLRYGEVEGATSLWHAANRLTASGTQFFAPLVSLTLYLCSATAEFHAARGPARQPQRPQPTRTKQGARFFPPPQPTPWEVSYRLGAALRH